MVVFLKFIKNFNNIKKTCKCLGIGEFLKKAIYHRHDDLILLGKDLNGEINFSFKDKLEIQSIEKKHLYVLEELCKPYDLYEKNPVLEFNEYFKNDCKGFMAILKGNIVGYIWWGNSKMGSAFEDPELRFMSNEIKIRLKNDDVCGFDLFLDPKYRGGGTAIEFLWKFFLALKKLGYNRVFGWVHADNRPARWTYKILGWKEIKRVAVRRIFLFMVLRGKKLFFDSAGHKCLYRFDEGTNEK